MKRLLPLLLLVVSWTSQALFAQDVIITKQSTRIDAKIVEVSDTEIRYKKHSNPDGPVFVINTEKVSSVLYENGEVQSFEATVHTNDYTENNTGTYEVLFRDGANIVSSKSMIYEPGNLRQMLGRDAYSNYLSAQTQYGIGATMIAFGWIDIPVGALMIIIGIQDEVPLLTIGGYVFAAAGDILLPLGYTLRGVAAGRISRIAEHYNAEHARQLSIDFDLAPTLLVTNDNIVPGVGFSLHF